MTGDATNLRMEMHEKYGQRRKLVKGSNVRQMADDANLAKDAESKLGEGDVKLAVHAVGIG